MDTGDVLTWLAVGISAIGGVGAALGLLSWRRRRGTYRMPLATFPHGKGARVVVQGKGDPIEGETRPFKALAGHPSRFRGTRSYRRRTGWLAWLPFMRYQPEPYRRRGPRGRR